MHNDLNRRHFDYYDALFAEAPERVAEMLSPTERLFGNRNIGYTDRTNRSMAMTTGESVTRIITNWYARTTLPIAAPEVQEFANWTYVDLIVGEHPMRTISLASLLAHSDSNHDYRHLEDDPQTQQRRHRSYIEHAAACIYEEIEGGSKAALFYGSDTRGLTEDERELRQKYMRIAEAAHKVISHEAPRVYVPPRQSVSVSVGIYGAGMDALKSVLRGFPRKASPSRAPGLWIHLQGIEVDVL